MGKKTREPPSRTAAAESVAAGVVRGKGAENATHTCGAATAAEGASDVENMRRGATCRREVKGGAEGARFIHAGPVCEPEWPDGESGLMKNGWGAATPQSHGGCPGP